MKNLFKKSLTEKPGVVGWLMIPSAFSAEVMAQCGWDALTVDLQHGIQDYQSMVSCFQAMQAHPVTPLVRVPANEPGIIGKVLDAGAHGVICPLVNTAQEAESFVSHCLYPPKGKRSNGPIRAGIYGMTENYQKTANDEILTIPMIETVEAVNNLEAILDVPGVNSILIGPTDLALSMGMAPTMDTEDQKILDVYQFIVDQSTKRGITVGLYVGSAAYCLKMIKMGFHWCAISCDSGLLSAASNQQLMEVRSGLKKF